MMRRVWLFVGWTGKQVDTAASVSPADLTAAVEAVGFTATCIASTTTEEPTLEQDGVNAVWAIASALGERATAPPAPPHSDRMERIGL